MSSKKRKHDEIKPADDDEAPVTISSKKRKTHTGAVAAKLSVSTPSWCNIGGVKGSILACGSGDMAQLGMGDGKTEALRPLPVHHLGDSQTNIDYIVAGGGANGVLVTSSGKKQVWTWGCNDHGLLGRPTKSEDDQATPAIVTDFAGKDIVQLSLGDYHMMGLDSDGHVWSWGTYRDANGIIGFKSGNEKQTTPQLMAELKEKRIISIASGENTSFALTDTGHLYMWGDARINQRSSGRHKMNALLPMVVPSNKTFTTIFAGGYHIFMIASDGNLWSMGLNNHNQLGTGIKEEIATIPKPVKGFPNGFKFKMAAAGQHHSLVLGEDGTVWSWGRGEYGQLGHSTKENLEAPKRIEFFDTVTKNGNHVVQISCGGHHSTATMSNGDVYSWGFGTMGQLGLGAMEGDEDRTIPTVLNNTDSRSKLYEKKVIWSSGGGQHTLFAVTNLKK